jgi:bifunctional DNase/RNase
MQEMVIYGVSFDMVGKQPIVLLKTRKGNKFLPIWIGHPEAAAILMKLQGANTPRPMTHDLLNDMLGELDVACSKVSVTELKENTFYASITLRMDGKALRRARARRTHQCADLRGRGRHCGVGHRVRARGRGPGGGRREVQGLPRQRDAGGLRRRQFVGAPARPASAGGPR